MKEEWQVVQRTRGSALKQLWTRLRTGIWVPTERFMYDGQVMPPIMGGAPGTTVDKQVGASADDGARRTGSFGFTATNASDYIGYHTSTSYLDCAVFARWAGVTIEGTIDVAYIECCAETNGVLTPELKVYGVDEDDPPAPTSAAEFEADPLTTAAVDWDGAWTDEAWEQSPSLNDIFQELVNTYTISNKAVMVQIKNDHGVTENTERNRLRQWNYTGNVHGAKLHIEYSAAAAGAPKQMMHYMRMRKE